MNIKRASQDIRFWILIYFLFNLFFIRTAPIEKSHNWRQTLTNSIARNYAENGGSIMYPKVDHGGSRSGIIASEFPAYNYAIGLCMKWFGFQHWYGRLINLLITLMGIWSFYRILQMMFDDQFAFYSSMFLLFSIWFAFGRKIMPDTLSVSLVLTGMLQGLIFLKKGNWWRPICMTALITLGLLIKMPAAVCLAPFALILFDKTTATGRKVLVSALVLISVIPTYWWYFKWIVHLNEFGFSLFFPRSLAQGWSEILDDWLAALENISFHSFYSFLAMVLFLIGIIRMVRTKDYLLIGIFTIGLLTFVYYALKTGFTFPRHSYYMVPFVPIMAMILSKGLLRFTGKPKYVVPLLFGLIAAESVANQQSDFRVRKADRAYLKLEAIADSIHGPESKVITNGGPSPTIMYFINRTGWALDDSNYEIDTETLNHLVEEGAEYLYLYRFGYDPTQSSFKYLVYQSEFLKVYTVHPPKVE